MINMSEVVKRIVTVMNYNDAGGKQYNRARISESQIAEALGLESGKVRVSHFEELRRQLDGHGFIFAEAEGRGGFVIQRLSALDGAPVLNIVGARTCGADTLKV